MLEARGVVKKVPGKIILDRVDFIAEKGSTVALLGPSGSGKTTLLRVLMGFEEIDAGTVSYNGRLMTDGRSILVRPHERNFGIVFQEFVLLPHLNVFDNIAMAVKGSSREDRQKTVNRFLEMFQIEGKAFSPVAGLSGGEQQRVALARTLAAEPELVLLDEPFSNLDKTFRLQLYDEIKTILMDKGTTTILVTHDHLESFYFSDKVYVIKDGQIIQEGTPAQVYEKPRNAWLASFVGEVNYLPCSTLRSDFGLPCTGDAEDTVYLIRPERMLFRENREADPGNGQVVQLNYLGGYELITVRLDSGVSIKLKDFSKTGFTVGSRISVRCSPENLIKCED
jgi:ABC-type Fe3+/spermidine/putrescine transport system ATPase subunit